MKREKCALCGRPHAEVVGSPDSSYCPGLSCWKAALGRLAEVGLTEKNTEKEKNR